MPRSHSAYSATESAGVRVGAQPSCLRASMSEKMCRVSPNRYSPVILAGQVGSVLPADDLGELLRRVRRAAADVEDLPGRRARP